MDSKTPQTLNQTMRLFTILFLVGIGFYFINFSDSEKTGNITDLALPPQNITGLMPPTVDFTVSLLEAVQPEENIEAIEVLEGEIEPIKKIIPISESEPVVLTLPPIVPKQEPITIVEIEEIPEVVVEKELGDPDSPFDVTVRIPSHYGGLLVPGKTLSFSTVVKNNGNEDLEDSFNTQLFIDTGNDGTIDITFKKLSTRALEVGDIETKIWRNAWIVESGVHRIEVCSDIDNIIIETDEKNNCQSIIIEIESPENSNKDLVVISINAIPGEINGTISFSATIQNQGGEGTKGFFVSLKINGVAQANTRIASLSDGMYKTLKWANNWIALPGDHTYEVCLDKDQEILETNEDNNCLQNFLSI